MSSKGKGKTGALPDHLHEKKTRVAFTNPAPVYVRFSCIHFPLPDSISILPSSGITVFIPQKLSLSVPSNPIDWF
jgi:hypothetical protein